MSTFTLGRSTSVIAAATRHRAIRRHATRAAYAALAMALHAGALGAQPPAELAQPLPADAQAAAADTAAARPAALYELNDVVLCADGRPAGGATIVARPVGRTTDLPPRVALSDSLGRFRLDSLVAGSYLVRVVHPQARRGYEQRVDIDGTTRAELVVPPDAQPRLRWTVVFLVAYAVTILAVRWHHIARSIHVMLMSQLTALSTRLATEVDANDRQLEPLRETVADLRKRFDPYKWGPISRIGEFFFWSRGNENAGWVAIHEIERQLAAFLAPPEYVESYLVWAEAQLRVVGSAPALALAESIRMTLQPPAPEDTTSPASREKARKALLGRALSVIYTERDMNFATLMEWHNKASWLILAALIIIGFLTAAAGNAVLFLAGAAGGFLSRVMRALKREDVPLDYGASWTTLFLSPLFGALAGWFGIAIIALATHPQVNLLGEAFAILDWYDPLSPFTLAVAFLLGFSERFFDAVVGAVERHAAGAEAAERAAHVQPGRPATGNTPPITGVQAAAATPQPAAPAPIPQDGEDAEPDDPVEDDEGADPDTAVVRAPKALLEPPEDERADR